VEGTASMCNLSDTDGVGGWGSSGPGGSGGSHCWMG